MFSIHQTGVEFSGKSNEKEKKNFSNAVTGAHKNFTKKLTSDQKKVDHKKVFWLKSSIEY